MSDPFHIGEHQAQALAGGLTPPGAAAAIRDFMPDQHRLFFQGLPYLFVATTDADGWPLATVLTGPPGFVQSPDPWSLRISGQFDDPAGQRLVERAPIGLLGLNLSNRRRNRANGFVAERDGDGLTVMVLQSFGNCPQYIQTRLVHPNTTPPGAVESFDGLDEAARAQVLAADTFFVASRARVANGGLDISHRGGRPGFVRVDGDMLTIPDFRGNRFFNTFGNLVAEPRAALMFVDFETGDLTHLRGEAEVLWDQTGGFEGAERLWRFKVRDGWRRRAAMPLRWAFESWSPVTERTGVWAA